MPSPFVVLLANLFQASIPLLSLAAYLPQWVKMRRQQSSANLSILSWLAWTLTSTFALFYAVVQFATFGAGRTLVFSAGINLMFVLVTLALVFHYRAPRQHA